MESSSDDDLSELLYLLASDFILLPISLKFFGLIGIILLFLVCSAMISGAEVAFFSLKKNDLLKLEKLGTYRARLIGKLLMKPRYLLSTILIANNLFNVATIIVATFTVYHWFNVATYPVIGFTLEVVVVAFLILLIGEIAPKVYATKNNIQLASIMAIPLLVLKKIFLPLNSILVLSTRIIHKRMDREGTDISASDLDHAIDLTTTSDTTTKEKKILKGLVHFGNIAAKQVMLNRMDVVALSINVTYSALQDVIKKHGYSRIPVYEKDIDNIKGILYSKDLLEFSDRGKDYEWQHLIRPPYFIPETKKIGDLLKDFQQRKIHFAIVVDEYGGTSGIVTLEDVLEEILGDIRDEFDKTGKNYVELDNNDFMFEGRTALSDITTIFNLKPDFFDKIKGESDSLAGLVLEVTGKMPMYKDEIPYEHFLFTVESVSKKRIHKIKLTVLDGAKKAS